MTPKIELINVIVALSKLSIDHNMRFKVIPWKLFYYQTFLKLGIINIHDMNIKKMQ